MFCKNCGAQIDDNAYICPHCQAQVKTGMPAAPYRSTALKSGTNTLAIVGFIFSFLFALVGLICSIIGYKSAPEYENGGSKGLALAGIIISAVSMVLSFILVLTVL